MLKAWVLEMEDTRYRFYQIALSRDVLVLVPVVTQCPERESFQPWVPIVAQSLSGTPFTRLLMLHLLLLSLPQPQGQQGHFLAQVVSLVSTGSVNPQETKFTGLWPSLSLFPELPSLSNYMFSLLKMSPEEALSSLHFKTASLDG